MAVVKHTTHTQVDDVTMGGEQHFEIRAVETSFCGKRYACRRDASVPVPDDQIDPHRKAEALLRLSRPEAACLMTQLWMAGVRPDPEIAGRGQDETASEVVSLLRSIDDRLAAIESNTYEANRA